ncbi:MAG: rhomboid family intramembrane serine protease [Verrucomicrobiota bacterium]
MSIYSRPYMREDYGSPGGRSYNAVLYLVVGLCILFAIQMVTGGQRGFGPVEQSLALSMENLKRLFLHTLVTYGYLHNTAPGLPWHLIINCFFLYMFGRHIQDELGPTRFLEFFHFTVLAGGIVAALVSLAVPFRIVIGASAGVSGVLALFALHRWNVVMEFLLFFVLPVRLSGKMIFFLLLGFQALFFLLAELPGTSTVAYSAHLGGMLGAVVYDRYLLSRGSFVDWVVGIFKPQSRKQPSWAQRGAAAKQRTGRFTLNMKRRDETPKPPKRSRPDLRGEVDRILDKINEQGFGALSAEEKRILEEAKDRLR